MLSEELVDIATRHQVYLERLKAGELKKTDVLFTALNRDLALILAQIEGSNLGVLTMIQAARLIEKVRKNQVEHYNKHLTELVLMLSGLTAFEREFELSAINEVTNDELEPDDGENGDTLWPVVMARPMSANGKLLSAWLGLWVANEVARGSDVISKAVAEGWTIQQLRQAFRGTPEANYTDGIFASSRRNTATTINTAIQHVSTTARQATMAATRLLPKGAKKNNGIKVDSEGKVTSISVRGRKAAAKAGIRVGDNVGAMGYRWIAILDSLTSQICRSLDQQVFQFGKGPLPPAHPNCRSTIIAEIAGRWLKRDALGRFVKKDERVATGKQGKESVDGKVTYYEWLKTQPADFQDDALGVTRATLFRKGGLSAEAFAKLNLGKRFQPLTLEEMRALAPRAFRRAGL